MYISAIICTHNRSRYLEKAIASLINQTLPCEHYEIIVVDNASTDDTKEVLRRLIPAPGAIRYLYEPVLGLSHTRNKGVAEARGDIVAFLDDDAIADSDWLHTILDTFTNVVPQPICVGGKVSPIWESPKPDWLPDSKLGILTVLDWGELPAWLEWGKQYLVGANIAFERETLLSLGGFNALLGRQGDGLLADEESLLLAMIAHKFGKKSIYYQPKAHVSHLIPDCRVSRRYLFKRYYSHAASAFLRSVILYKTLSADDQQIMKDAPLWEVSKFRFFGTHINTIYTILKVSVYALLASSKPKRTEHLFHVAFKLGQFIESSKYVLGFSRLADWESSYSRQWIKHGRKAGNSKN